MWQDSCSAFALVLVLEGIMPFLNPRHFRRGLLLAAQLNDASLRGLGLTAMVLGVFMLYVLR